MWYHTGLCGAASAPSIVCGRSVRCHPEPHRTENAMIRNPLPPTSLTLSSFRYDLPPERIAQTPAEPRDSSRLMVLDRRTGRTEHRIFRDVIDYLNPADVLVINDDVTCNILQFSTREKSGFILKDLSGQIHVDRHNIIAKNMTVETPFSHIATDAKLSYNGWKGMRGYVHTVQHEAKLKPSTRVAMSDAAYWAPVLWGIDATVSAQGTFSGTIDSMVTDMNVRWGESSTAQVEATIIGLPKIDTTVFDVDVEHLVTNREDLRPLLEKMRSKDGCKKSRKMDELIAAVDHVDMIASVQGGISDHAAVNILAGLRSFKALTAASAKKGVTSSAQRAMLGFSLLS